MTNTTPSLADRVLASETLLLALLRCASPERVRVAWTGGKDSTVVLFLWKTVLEHRGLGPVRAISLDTGCKFPEILTFRDRLAAGWGVDLHVARPGPEAAACPLARDAVECCRLRKIEPLKRALAATGTSHLLTGLRRDEHPDRAGRRSLEPRLDPDHTLVNPILDWTESEVWAFHDRFGLDRCSLYDQGYRSLGCRPCTAPAGTDQDERAGRSQGKEAALATLTSLGYF